MQTSEGVPGVRAERTCNRFAGLALRHVHGDRRHGPPENESRQREDNERNQLAHA